MGDRAAGEGVMLQVSGVGWIMEPTGLSKEGRMGTHGKGGW